MCAIPCACEPAATQPDSFMHQAQNIAAQPVVGLPKMLSAAYMLPSLSPAICADKATTNPTDPKAVTPETAHSEGIMPMMGLGESSPSCLHLGSNVG